MVTQAELVLVQSTTDLVIAISIDLFQPATRPSWPSSLSAVVRVLPSTVPFFLATLLITALRFYLHSAAAHFCHQSNPVRLF